MQNINKFQKDIKIKFKDKELLDLITNKNGRKEKEILDLIELNYKL